MNNYYFKEIDKLTGKLIGYKIFPVLLDLSNFSSPNTTLIQLSEKDFYYEMVESDKASKEQAENILISSKELLSLSNETHNHMTFTPYQIYQTYYYYYARWIWQLINYRGCSYKWINVNDYNFNLEEVSKKSCTDWSTAVIQNEYLQLYQESKIELGRDIIKNGLYFPFIIGTNQMSNELPVIFGKHRLYSLLLNPDETKDMEFLFIIFPHGFDYFDTYKSNQNNDYQKNEIICTYLHPSYSWSIYEYKTNQENVIFSEFSNFSDHLPDQMFQYRDIIKPNPIFNNKNAFEDFINNPFEESELIKIQKLWKI